MSLTATPGSREGIPPGSLPSDGSLTPRVARWQAGFGRSGYGHVSLTLGGLAWEARLSGPLLVGTAKA